MTFDELNCIDFVIFDTPHKEVLLTICDHMSWDKKDGTAYLDEESHLRLLQEKIYLYLGAVKTGEIYERWPEAMGLKPIIELVAKYQLSKAAEQFIRRIGRVVEAEHCSIRVSYFPGDDDDMNREGLSPRWRFDEPR